MFTPETARSVMYPVLLTLGGSALLASIAFFAKKYFIGRGGIGRSERWEVDSGGGGGGGRQVRVKTSSIRSTSKTLDSFFQLTSRTSHAFQSAHGNPRGPRVMESELKAYKNRAFSETGLGGTGSTTLSSSSSFR